MTTVNEQHLGLSTALLDRGETGWSGLVLLAGWDGCMTSGRQGAAEAGRSYSVS